MSEFPIKFTITLEDQVSAAVGSVKSGLSGLGEGFNSVGTNIQTSEKAMGSFVGATKDSSAAVQQASNNIGTLATSTEKASTSTKQHSVSMQDSAIKFNTLAVSGLTLAMSFESIEKAQLASDKANLNVQRSTEKLERAQNALTDTTMKYGAGSDQAKQAQDNLRIAEETHNVAIERQDMVSQDLNQTYMQTAVSIIPAVIGVMTSFKGITDMVKDSTIAQSIAEAFGVTVKSAAIGPTGALTTAQWSLNSAMLANPIVWVVAGIAALVAAVILAYNYCQPFKDAVNALGAALGDGLGKALAVVKGALEWLWNNVFEPFVAFLSFGAMIAINKIIDALKWLGDVLKPIGDAFGWLAGVVGGAFDSIGKSTDEYTMQIAAIEASTKNGLGVMENFYSIKFSEMTATVNEELAKQLETINKSYADGVAAQNAAYKTEMDIFIKSWTDKYTVAETEISKLTAVITKYYDDQIKAVQDSTQKQIDVLQGAYDKELTDFTAHWASVLGIQTTELDKVNSDINAHYDAQVKAVQDGAQKEIDALQTAYNQELSDFTTFWDTKLGIHNTELDQVNQAITTHYDNEISDLETAYNAQIDATNTLYDGMLTATNAGLASLRGAHQQSNDDNELLMLEQKVTIQQAYAGGLIDEETYKKQLGDLSKTYNEARGIANDTFRLNELRLEAVAKAEGITIEEARAAELSGIALKEKTDITGINAEKNADLTAAQTTYKDITETDANKLKDDIAAVKEAEKLSVNKINDEKDALLKQAAADYHIIAHDDMEKLTLAIAALKRTEATDVNKITKQKNSDLDDASKGFNTIEQGNANELLKLQTKCANDIHDASVAAVKQKQIDLDKYEKDINADVTLTEAEKVRLITKANDDIEISTNTSWGAISSTIHRTVGQIQGDLVAMGASIATAQTAAAGISSIEDMANSGRPLTANEQALKNLYQESVTFQAAVSSGQYSKAQIQGSLDATNRQIRALGGTPQYLAEGGIVTKPTYALIGEAGPEAVIPLKDARGASSFMKQAPVFNVTVNPYIHIGTVSSKMDLAVVEEVIIEKVNKAIGELSQNEAY